ncbi:MULTISPECIES: DUF3888 domain-containing protein [unclassified Paenibacillus]|uniref:DUF3888 domain-containing protein n=1 Tax=unclassified Paenibacillus TaxID=185978 RepID=UPI0006835A8A|nr:MULTISPECIES: DUF3888 domain-containing protein [unclassified Paenibacillus]
MKKIPKLLLMCVLSIMFLPSPVSAEPLKASEHNITDAFLATIAPAIGNALTGYYGKLKQFELYDAKVVSLERKTQGGFDFICKVAVTTFEGAHNPPYGDDILTLDISGGKIHVIKFEHKDKRKDWPICN